MPLLLQLGCHRKPKTPQDQVSYAIGMQFGRSLKAQKLDLNVKAVERRASATHFDRTSARASATKRCRPRSRPSVKSHQEKMKVEAEHNKKGAVDFLTSNKTSPRREGDRQRTAVQASRKRGHRALGPKIDDAVVVNYRGTLAGRHRIRLELQAPRRRPSFRFAAVIPGWTEGLQLMKKGGTATFYVPPELGYGDRSRQQIPANAVLTFEVELLDVKPGRPPAAPAQPKKVIERGHDRVVVGRQVPAAGRRFAAAPSARARRRGSERSRSRSIELGRKLGRNEDESRSRGAARRSNVRTRSGWRPALFRVRSTRVTLAEVGRGHVGKFLGPVRRPGEAVEVARDHHRHGRGETRRASRRRSAPTCGPRPRDGCGPRGRCGRDRAWISGAPTGRSARDGSGPDRAWNRRSSAQSREK